MQKATSWLRKTDLFFKRSKSIWILLVPVALFFVPIDWLDRQQSICLFRNIFGQDCYGCGISRAVLSSLHFDLERAYHFNKLIIIVLPLLVYIWSRTFILSLIRK